MLDGTKAPDSGAKINLPKTLIRLYAILKSLKK